MPPHADVLKWEHLPFPKSLPQFQKLFPDDAACAIPRGATLSPGAARLPGLRRQIVNPKEVPIMIEISPDDFGAKLMALKAYALYRAYCGGRCPPRVPGMDTVVRLALRISKGCTAEQAAAAEYIYRWHLAIKAPDQCMRPHNTTRDPVVSVFGTPHAIGM